MDNVEARLQDLARDAEQTLAGQTIVPRSDVARRGRVRRAGLFIGSAALVAVLAVGGYAGAGAIRGGSQLQPADSNVLMAAAETTELEDTARAAFAMEVSYDMGGATKDQKFEGAGELSFVDDMSHFVMQLEGEGEPELMQEIVQDGLVVYTKDSSSDGWSKLELEESGSSTTFGSAQMRPEELLDYLSDVTGGIEIVGEEEIDGEPVTHYSGEFDVDSLRSDLSPDERAALEMYDTDFEPVHVWVDDRGRVRKMSFVVQVAMENDGQSFGMSMSYSMSLFDFGEPVDIDVPDESEVTESSSVDGDTQVEDAVGDVVHSEEIELQEPEADGKSLTLLGEGGFDAPLLALMNERNWEGCFANIPAWAKTVGLYRDGLASPLAEAEVMTSNGQTIACGLSFSERRPRLEEFATELAIRIEAPGRTLEVPVVRTVGG